MKSIKLYDLGRDRDYISNLHEDVLSHILSRLSTEDAVQTSILSKAWRYKWTSTYNVDLDDSVIGKEEILTEFVDMMLVFGKHVKNFRLICGGFYELECVQTWISTALRHDLESLEVKCDVEGTFYPCSLLNSASLRKLKLSYCTLNIAAKNICSNLTSLDLHDVKIVNENPNIRTVAFTFPVLETLILFMCEWLNVKHVEINAPLLTTFSSSPRYIWAGYACSFALMAPRLAKFMSQSSRIPEEFVLTGSSVVSATVTYEYKVRDQLVTNIGVQFGKLLNQLKNVEVLWVGTYVAEVSRLGPPLCCHDKLTKLIIIGRANPGTLFHILHAAPSLKFLKMLVPEDCEWEMEPVPSCIVSQLEEVEFVALFRSPARYNMAKFLLKNGERLKRMTLHGFGKNKLCPKRLKVRDILLGFPRRSSSLIIE